jgi:predicted lipoprotein with Yx(FWY)xxD motif
VRRTSAVVPLAVGTALLVGGAASHGATSGGAAGKPAVAHSSASGKVVKTRHGALGTYLVDAKGRSLYLWEADSGRKSTCYGPCAKAWPPLITHGKPRARGRAKQSLLSTSKRRNGARQVLYKGHPLYYFIADKKAGDTKGQGSQGFGAGWYVMKPSGKKIDKD